MTITQEQATWFADTFQRLSANVGQAVLGKQGVIRLVLTSLLAEGHVLLEDAPGTGKTCLLYTSPSPRDLSTSRMPSSA